MTINEIIEAFKKIAEQSNTLITWAFSIIGASILAIVSTSYLKPSSRKMKLIYLLFVPGWGLLAKSTYYGNLISRNLIASLLTKDTKTILDINREINDSFSNQLTCFFTSLIFFGTWLVLYVLWWIFDSWSINSKEK